MLKSKICCISLLFTFLSLYCLCFETLGCRNKQGIKGEGLNAYNPILKLKTVVLPAVKNKYDNLVEPCKWVASAGLFYALEIMCKIPVLLVQSLGRHIVYSPIGPRDILPFYPELIKDYGRYSVGAFWGMNDNDYIPGARVRYCFYSDILNRVV